MNPEKQNRLENVLEEISRIQKSLFEMNTRLGNLTMEVTKLTEEDNTKLFQRAWNQEHRSNPPDETL